MGGPKAPERRNAPDSKSHGTLAQTALPQVLLEEECNRTGYKLEWHERAIQKAADRPVGFSGMEQLRFLDY
jgi:hypothetical protein